MNDGDGLKKIEPEQALRSRIVISTETAGGAELAFGSGLRVTTWAIRRLCDTPFTTGRSGKKSVEAVSFAAKK